MKIEHWLAVAATGELVVASVAAFENQSRLILACAMLIAAAWGGSLVLIHARNCLDVARQAVAELEDKR